MPKIAQNPILGMHALQKRGKIVQSLPFTRRAILLMFAMHFYRPQLLAASSFGPLPKMAVGKLKMLKLAPQQVTWGN